MVVGAWGMRGGAVDYQILSWLNEGFALSKEKQGYIQYSTVHTLHGCTRTYSTDAVSDFPIVLHAHF